MMTGRRVVVTGLGVVAPVGQDVQSAWKAILNGESGIQPITHFDISGFTTQFGGPIYNFDVTRYIPKKDLKKMDYFIHYGMAAGIQAWEDSGIEVTEQNSRRIGVAIGSGIGGTGHIEALTILEAEHIDVTGLTVTGAVYKSPLTRRTLNIQQEPALEITHIGRNRVTNGRIYIDKPGTTRISFKVKGMKLSKNIQLIIAVQGITPDSKKEVVAKVNPNGTGWADVEVVPGVNLITAYFKFKK